MEQFRKERSIYFKLCKPYERRDEDWYRKKLAQDMQKKFLSDRGLFLVTF